MKEVKKIIEEFNDRIEKYYDEIESHEEATGEVVSVNGEVLDNDTIETLKKEIVEVDTVDSVVKDHHSIKFDLENKEDVINYPSHYTFGKFEVIDVAMDWFPDDPLLWQVLKYIARCKHKGKEKQDLKKAEFYLKKRIENCKQEN